MPLKATGELSAVVAFAAVLAFTLVSDDQYALHLLIWIALNSLLAVALRFVLLVGEKNVATAAFYGIGAYASAIATTMLDLPFFVSLIAAGIVAAAASAAFGLVTLRIKGPYFMLVSFALTEFMRLLYTRIDAIGGASGIVGIFPPRWLDPWMTTFTIGVVGALLAVLYACERSNLGKIFKAIGDNDAIVASVGIDVVATKLLCLVLASFAVGIGGALQAHTSNIISPGDFGYACVVYAFAYMKIGGTSHILGSVLGAALLILFDQWLQGSGPTQEILFGGAIVLGMLLLPNGLIGLINAVAASIRGRLQLVVSGSAAKPSWEKPR